MRVLQLNAATLFEPDHAARRSVLARAIDGLELDIICAQEVSHRLDGDVALEVLGQSGWHSYFGGFPVRGDGFGDDLRFGSAIFSTEPLEDTERLQLSSEGDEYTGQRLERELVVARTHGIDVLTTHLTPRAEHAELRRIQVAEICEVADQRLNEGLGTAQVLCGDFNSLPGSLELEPLFGRTAGMTSWIDAWRAAHAADPGFTVDPLNPYFRPYALPAMRIDYIYVRTTDKARRVQLTISTDRAFDGREGAPIVSDHYGLIMDFDPSGK